MPKKLISSVRLELCNECGSHGNLIFSDGSHVEVTSQQGIVYELKQAYREGRILLSEAEVIMRQVMDSSLPEEYRPAVTLILIGNTRSKNTRATDQLTISE